MSPPRIRFARQVLALQIGVVVLVVGVGFLLVNWLLDKELTDQYGQRALAVAGSALLSRRLKRLTLGLEPHELAELLQEREAVLHGIGEGVLAIDTDGRVSVCNDEAARLLGVAPPAGTPAADLDLPPRLRA